MTSPDTSDSMQKTCEACGQSFACSASEAACWCEQVQLPSDARANLGARFSDCLCPACLDAAARGESVKKFPPA